MSNQQQPAPRPAPSPEVVPEPAVPAKASVASDLGAAAKQVAPPAPPAPPEPSPAPEVAPSAAAPSAAARAKQSAAAAPEAPPARAKAAAVPANEATAPQATATPAAAAKPDPAVAAEPGEPAAAARQSAPASESAAPNVEAGTATTAMDRVSFERILLFGVERGISDLHFEAGHPPHLRLQGDLLPAKYPSLTPEDTLAVASMMLYPRDFDEFCSTRKERDITYAIKGVSRFRATVFWQQGHVGVVLRVIPLVIRNFEQLNLPDSFDDICLARRGLILVTGATGNGKSTTLAAMLHRINQTRRAHVVTIEDPIEFLFPKEKSLIIQREVGVDTGSFREALIAAMRQDPDIIMIGEVRDYETAEICLKGAETGHLVMTAIHTPDAVRTIQRFVGLFPPEDHDAARVRLAEALKATVSLRLLPTSDGNDRIPAVEVMRVTRTIQECIRIRDKTHEVPHHIAQGRDLYGMQVFDQHLLELYQRKKISYEVARMAASNTEEFQRALMIE